MPDSQHSHRNYALCSCRIHQSTKLRSSTAPWTLARWNWHCCAGVSLGGEVEQDDQAYAPATWSYGVPKLGDAFARLRTAQGRHLFTVKMPAGNELSCREQETSVGCRDQMHEALLLMGWVPTVRIHKRRRTGLWDGAGVCVDAVTGLGTFLELEAFGHLGVPQLQV